MKRICSSSTLIGGDLAKRSPKHDEYNSCASSASPRALLQITNGETSSNELAEMMWNDEQSQDHANKDNTQSGPQEQVIGGDGGGGYFSKYEDDECDSDSSSRVGLVHQAPPFALWND